MRYRDQKTTIFSELANIMETDQFAMYDLLDVHTILELAA